jgi:predicted nucleotide-binding protein
MAKKRKPEGPAREQIAFRPEDATRAKDRLQRRISELSALDPEAAEFAEQAKILLDKAVSTVGDIFGDREESSQFRASMVQGFPDTVSFRGGPDEGAMRTRRREQINRAVPRLKSLISTIDEKTFDPAPAASRPGPEGTTSRRVFVVHGHDEAVKQAVARTLERLQLEPIILHEWPDKGRTIIEKLEAHTDVGYAVVLMTPDDRGGPKTEPFDSYRFRARQNVLVELGVFLGKLGRSRVTVIYDRDVEMPSDYDGVLFKRWDGPDGSWRFELAKEIRAAGIPVDLNQL